MNHPLASRNDLTTQQVREFLAFRPGWFEDPMERNRFAVTLIDNPLYMLLLLEDPGLGAWVKAFIPGTRDAERAVIRVLASIHGISDSQEFQEYYLEYSWLPFPEINMALDYQKRFPHSNALDAAIEHASWQIEGLVTTVNDWSGDRHQRTVPQDLSDLVRMAKAGVGGWDNTPLEGKTFEFYFIYAALGYVDSMSSVGGAVRPRSASPVVSVGSSPKLLPCEEIEAVLAQCNGNRAAAAKLLGMHTSTLTKNLQAYGIDAAAFSSVKALTMEAVEQALAQTDGNRTEAGRLLGVSAATISRFLIDNGHRTRPAYGTSHRDLTAADIEKALHSVPSGNIQEVAQILNVAVSTLWKLMVKYGIKKTEAQAEVERSASRTARSESMRSRYAAETEEEKAARRQLLSETKKREFASMTPEQRAALDERLQTMALRSREWWQSATPEQREEHSRRSSENTLAHWRSITSEQYAERTAKLKRHRISPDDVSDWEAQVQQDWAAASYETKAQVSEWAASKAYFDELSPTEQVRFFSIMRHGRGSESVGVVRGGGKGQKKSATSKRYFYVGNCTDQSWELDIHALQRSGKIIDRADFVRLTRNADRTGLERSMGYDRGFSIVKDWHVNYYKGVFRGVPAVYMVHSHIEYIFTLDGKIGPATTEDGEEVGASHGGYPKLYKGYRNKGYTKPLPSPVSVPYNAPIGTYQARLWNQLQGAAPRYKHHEKALRDLATSLVTPAATLEDMLGYFMNEVSTYRATQDRDLEAFAQEMVDLIRHNPTMTHVGSVPKGASYQIANAEAKHRQHGKDFLIHTLARRKALQPGKDYVKVIFEGKLPDGQRWGERMWLKVTGKAGNRFTGKLDGKSLYEKSLKNGTIITFGPEHVTQIIKDGKYLDFDGSLKAMKVR